MPKITVINQKNSEIIEKKFIDVNPKKPVILTALADVSYELLSLATGKTPKNILIRRTDNNLEMSIDGDAKTDVIIENYFLYDSVKMIGKDDFGETYTLIYEPRSAADNTYQLATNTMFAAISPVEHTLATPMTSSTTEVAEVNQTATEASRFLYLNTDTDRSLVTDNPEITNTPHTKSYNIDTKEIEVAVTPIDAKSPAASISVVQSVLIIGDFTDINITFNEAVTNLEQSDFSVDNGRLTNLKTDDNVTWTATLTAESESSFNAISLQNTYTDIAGNIGNTAISNNYVIEHI